jgi:two-component system cell cycle response regulator DivK
MSKILIVEDVEINLELLIQLLEEDHQLLSAGDGRLGVEIAISEQPDLIIMDMSLPVLDGWSATREIRSNIETADIPVIALSAHAMISEKERAFEAGCSAYLTKPVDEGLLFRTIEELLKVDA